MSVSLRRDVLAVVVLVCLALPPCRMLAATGEPEPWRTSFDAFARAIVAFPIGEVPYAKTDEQNQIGERVGRDTPIMKRFGASVELEGSFRRVVPAAASAPRGAKEKIEIEMTWPAVGRDIAWTLHVYPKAGTARAWKALKPKTSVRFRAVVTGITRAHTFISGVDLRAYSILLEEAEILPAGEKAKTPRR